MAAAHKVWQTSLVTLCRDAQVMHFNNGVTDVSQEKKENILACAHTQTHPSIFTASIHLVHPPRHPLFPPSSPLSHPSPPLIAPLVPPFLQIHRLSCLPPLIGATWYLSPHCSRSDHLFPSACSQLCLCIAVHASRWDDSNSWDTTTNLSMNQSRYHLLALPLVFERAFVCINALMGVPFICFHFPWTSLSFSPFIEF